MAGERLAEHDRLLLAMLDKEIYADQHAARRLTEFLERCLAGMGIKPGDRVDFATGVVTRAAAAESAGDGESGSPGGEAGPDAAAAAGGQGAG
jgi:hypothetical protein